LNRTTNGKGLVYDHKLHQLKRLDAGKGERIPTLSQALRLIRNKARVIIELKGSYTEKKVVDLVQKHNLVQNVVLSSFNHSRLARAKKLDPHIKLAYTYNRLSVRTFRQLTHPAQVHVRHQFISKALLKEAHKHGVEVFAWTPNAKRAIKKLVSLGVDGIATDNPELLKKL